MFSSEQKSTSDNICVIFKFPKFLSITGAVHEFTLRKIPVYYRVLGEAIIFFQLISILFTRDAAAKSLQSCSTLCDPIDGSPPGSPVPGILQARTLEWVAIFFSNAGKWKVKVKSLSCVRLLANPMTTAYQAPLSMGFSRQEYWRWVGGK